MTSFHEILFPINYAGGTQGGPMYSNRIAVSDSGAETRVQMWSNARLTFEIGYTADPADMTIITTFFRARKGRIYGFRFRDWSDYTAVSEPLVTASVMQLQKTYQDAAGSEIRLIKKPNTTDTVYLYDNGVSVSYTLDYTTGLITPTTYHSSHTYTWSGSFDVPVRFDTDKLTYIQETPSRRSIQSTPLVEVLI